MGFWTLFEVATMPILQVLLITLLGALLATDYLNHFNSQARKSMNKIVFLVFLPSLIFSSLAKDVTLQDIISWWFMPIDVALTFVVGGMLGWIAVKILKPKPHLEGLIIAICSSGNTGNIVIIMISAICKENGSPFGDYNVCSPIGMSYIMFSMSISQLCVWTCSYYLVSGSAIKHKDSIIALEEAAAAAASNNDLAASVEYHLLQSVSESIQNNIIVNSQKGSISKSSEEVSAIWAKLFKSTHKVLERILTPPTIGAILGFIIAATPWLKNLIIGDEAPFRVIQDTIQILGGATIPCMTLILGGDLTRGLRKSEAKPKVVIAIILVRYVLSPMIGIGIVRTSHHLGFLPRDPLYEFVLMLQFALPPAMSVGAMTQLFDIAQEECSTIFMWSYLTAVFSLTLWSTIFMWILS